MAGADDNVTVITDWMPNPSLRTMFSNLLTDGFGSRSFSDLLTEGGSQGPLPEPEKQQSVVTNSKEEGADGEFQFSCLTSMQSTTLGVQKPGSQSSKPGSRSGLAERAARAGFSTPTINTAHIRSGNVDSSSSDVRSPYVMIPPGLSPATLLESPVFLSNVMAQPSPTTGKFSFEQLDNSNSNSSIGILDNSKDQLLEDNVHESFAFKPPLESSFSYFTNVDNKATSSTEHQPSLPSIEVSVWSEQAAAADFKNQQNYGNQTGFSDSSVKKDSADDIMFNQRVSDSLIGNEHSSPPEDQQDGEGEPKGEFSSVAAGAPAEDGYNWRKYGQKQVKGGEYPRSYYKCTHLNCQVKKKVERSHDGHIIEIIYKGAHNHPKPPPNRRSGIAPYPYSDMQVDGSEHSGSQAATDDKPLWTGAQEWRNDGPEASSSASIPAEFIDPSDPLPAQEGPRFESSDAIDVSSTLSNDEDEDDRATHGSVSLGCEGERDETESKRRKFDSCAMEMNAASRVVREPRVVVQTTSEVDILDDGYRWRKYGQKVVKGNPNPRSYYKCTNPGCTVRKHVERASHDLKSVITTYEGKHNHDVPAARNSGHTSSGPSTTAATPASQSHNLHGRPEPVQVQDSLMRFDSSAPLSTFGLPGTEQLRPPPGFAFGMGQQGLTNLTIAGLSPVAPLKMPVLPPVHPYMGHHRQVIKGGFMLPKGERKEEPISENGLPMSNGASMYYQMMGRLPLGPQL